MLPEKKREQNHFYWFMVIGISVINTPCESIHSLFRVKAGYGLKTSRHWQLFQRSPPVWRFKHSVILKWTQFERKGKMCIYHKNIKDSIFVRVRLNWCQTGTQMLSIYEFTLTWTRFAARRAPHKRLKRLQFYKVNRNTVLRQEQCPGAERLVQLLKSNVCD